MLVNDLFSLEGKVAAVIGGGGVLAGCMAQGFGSAGAKVAVIDLNKDNAEAQARAICPQLENAMAVACDATSKSDLERSLAEILAKWGQVDILLNAAGINSATPFFEITEQEWRKIMDVDLTSVFFACQVFGKHMVDRGQGGSVINISSASSGPPLSRVFTYGVAKGGVNQITQFLAREWAPYRVRVNAILPGFFPAEQNRKLLTEERRQQIMSHTPMKRYGESSELVGAAIYLASDKAASFVTGSIMRVDGGFMAMTI
jgi:NAD(P)-dependent dehydrogenase (short-subunit alcohol dehydrogenase family)